MAFAPSSPITGGPQTGFTSPTYTIVSDTPPNAHSVQYAVTALGGTQTGVTTHTVSSPFTITAERPAQFRQLGSVNPVTGVISNVPMNVSKIRTRKGVLPAASQPHKTCIIETFIRVPAGADTYDAANVLAAMSAHIGVLWAQSANTGQIPIVGTV
jgi:hypothetical protein